MWNQPLPIPPQKKPKKSSSEICTEEQTGGWGTGGVEEIEEMGKLFLFFSV